MKEYECRICPAYKENIEGKIEAENALEAKEKFAALHNVKPHEVQTKPKI